MHSPKKIGKTEMILCNEVIIQMLSSYLYRDHIDLLSTLTQ